MADSQRAFNSRVLFGNFVIFPAACAKYCHLCSLSPFWQNWLWTIVRGQKRSRLSQVSRHKGSFSRSSYLLLPRLMSRLGRVGWGGSTPLCAVRTLSKLHCSTGAPLYKSFGYKLWKVLHSAHSQCTCPRSEPLNADMDQVVLTKNQFLSSKILIWWSSPHFWIKVVTNTFEHMLYICDNLRQPFGTWTMNIIWCRHRICTLLSNNQTIAQVHPHQLWTEKGVPSVARWYLVWQGGMKWCAKRYRAVDLDDRSRSPIKLCSFVAGSAAAL